MRLVEAIPVSNVPASQRAEICRLSGRRRRSTTSGGSSPNVGNARRTIVQSPYPVLLLLPIMLAKCRPDDQQTEQKKPGAWLEKPGTWSDRPPRPSGSPRSLACAVMAAGMSGNFFEVFAKGALTAPREGAYMPLIDGGDANRT